MVTYHDSTPGRSGRVGLAAVRRAAAAADPAAARDAEIDRLLSQADEQLVGLQRLLDDLAEQQAVVAHGTAVVAEFAKQAQQRLDRVGRAADDLRLDEIAELLRRQSPARQRALLETLEGGAE